jgi:hypothetical protein
MSVDLANPFALREGGAFERYQRRLNFTPHPCPREFTRRRAIASGAWCDFWMWIVVYKRYTTHDGLTEQSARSIPWDPKK